MGSKPITQRAKCNYTNMSIQPEVTVDAAGKQRANFPSSSPLRKVNDSLIAGAGAMGAASIMPDIEEQDKSYLRPTGEFSEEEKERIKNNRIAMAQRREEKREARYAKRQIKKALKNNDLGVPLA